MSRDDLEHQHNDETSCPICNGSGCDVCTLVNGDTCTSCGHEEHGTIGNKIDWTLTIVTGIVIVIGILLPFLGIEGLVPILVLISSMIMAGYKSAINGVKILLKGNITIDLLVTIAAIGATIIGQYEEGALVVFLKDISFKLEIIAAERARHAVEALMELRPEVATIRRGETETIIPVDQVIPGEIFIVMPGDRVPLDGIVVDGETTIDQSTITGESMPIPKGYLDEVYAGTINLDGYLAVKTLRASSESMISNILRMVTEAELRRSPTETFVNQFAKYYTPFIIILAILYAVVPHLIWGTPIASSVYNSLVLLVIGCPCALTIATPVAMVSAITSASRNGVLIKGSTFIEEINKAKVFAFDKTGTLTIGKPKITDIQSIDFDESDLLSIAAALEENSKHPIALAIKEKAILEKIPRLKAESFKSQTGKGVEAIINGETYRIGNTKLYEAIEIEYPDDSIKELETQGKTIVLVARENDIIGLISLMDERRTGAKESVQGLRKKGMKVEMLTGDNETTALAIAEQVGFNGFHANLLPEDKVNTIEELKKHGKVVMVGDGVNDAPALAAADVGIAMGGLGSDIALETADIVLLEDDLTRLNYIQKLSIDTLIRIKENISISIIMKLIIVILAAMGKISLWMSVILGDVGLALMVILNSIRISGIKPTSYNI